MNSIEGFFALFCMVILVVIFMLIYFVVKNRQIINNLDTEVNKYIDEDIIKLRNVIRAVNYNNETLNKKQKYLTKIINNNDNFSYTNGKKNNGAVDEENVLNIKEIDFSNNDWNVFDTVTARSALDNLM